MTLSATSARPLGLLRIFVGLLLLAQAIALFPYIGELCGSRGLIQDSLVDALMPKLVPRLGWAVSGLGLLGVSETTALNIMFMSHAFAALALLLGWRTRLAAVVAWLTHVALMTSSSPSAYGANEFLTIALFYSVLAPVGHAWSLDRLLARVPGGRSAQATIWLRVIQVHLAIVYLSSGIEKASGIQWWNGEALWRALMRPEFTSEWVASLAALPFVAPLGCWMTLVIELGYALFIWHPRTRTLWLLATLGLHVMIGVLLGLWLFASVMIALNVSAHLHCLLPHVAEPLPENPRGRAVVPVLRTAG